MTRTLIDRIAAYGAHNLGPLSDVKHAEYAAAAIRILGGPERAAELAPRPKRPRQTKAWPQPRLAPEAG